MPRQARVVSSTGIYHILLTTVNNIEVFSKDENADKLIDILQEYKEQCAFHIYAYCIMPTHVHLLIQTEQTPLGEIFKKVGGKYVAWYNKTYKRTGALFHDRYKSQGVEDVQTFEKVFQYIHYNPVFHNVTKDATKYRFSSYAFFNDFYNKDSFYFGLVNPQYVFSRFSAAKLLQPPVLAQCDEILELKNNVRIPEEQVASLIYQVTQCAQKADFLALPIIVQEAYIVKLKNHGISFRQLERHTGVSMSVLRKYCSQSSSAVIFPRSKTEIIRS